MEPDADFRHAAPGAEVVRTKFEFKNTTKKTVHILEVGTSCGCTEATPTRATSPRRERRRARAVYGRTAHGPAGEGITILTDEASEPVRLALKVSLPAAKAAVAAAK